MTASDVKPSLFINLRASLRGLSPLRCISLPYVLSETQLDVLDGYSQLGADPEILDGLGVECINDWEISAILPEKLDQP